MTPVPTIHVRNVPQEVYEPLVRQADEAGRSLNAEVIEILRREVERRRRTRGLKARIEALNRRIDLPPGAPMPEDLIRADRDSR